MTHEAEIAHAHCYGQELHSQVKTSPHVMSEGPSTHPKFLGAAFSRVSEADFAVLLRPLVT